MAGSPRVVIGADTHRDTNHLAVITDAGKPLADAEFPTSPSGYDDAVRWARSFGTVMIAGVEGTFSYGAGLTRVLQGAGIEVAEVSRRELADLNGSRLMQTFLPNDSPLANFSNTVPGNACHRLQAARAVRVIHSSGSRWLCGGASRDSVITAAVTRSIG